MSCLLMTHFVLFHGSRLLESFIKAYCSAPLTCRAVEWENVVFDNCQSVADLPVGMIQSVTYGKRVSVEAPNVRPASHFNNNPFKNVRVLVLGHLPA